MKNIFYALSVATILFGCAAPPTTDELASADYGSYPSDYEKIITAYIGTVLKDPDSARVQFLNAPKTAWTAFGGKKFGYVVCTYINAKNSYGGYVGKRMSYFMIRNDRVIDASHGDGNYGEAIVQGRCKPFI